MRRLTFAVLCLLVLVPTTPATASTRNKIIKDCADDGVLQGRYSPGELRDARQNLPSDVAEYTDCADVLRRAELPDQSGGGAGGSGGGAGGFGGAPDASSSGGAGAAGLLSPTTDADHAALARAAEVGGQPVTVGRSSIAPSARGFRAAAIRNDLPGTLLAALVLLAVAGAALAVPGLRRLLPPARRRGT